MPASLREGISKPFFPSRDLFIRRNRASLKRFPVCFLLDTAFDRKFLEPSFPEMTLEARLDLNRFEETHLYPEGKVESGAAQDGRDERQRCPDRADSGQRSRHFCILSFRETVPDYLMITPSNLEAKANKWVDSAILRSTVSEISKCDKRCRFIIRVRRLRPEFIDRPPRFRDRRSLPARLPSFPGRRKIRGTRPGGCRHGNAWSTCSDFVYSYQIFPM